jgi:hypothetical protein
MILGRRLSHGTITKWSTFFAAWLLIIVTVVIGPVTANVKERGAYCAFPCLKSARQLLTVSKMVFLETGVGSRMSMS